MKERRESRNSEQKPIEISKELKIQDFTNKALLVDYIP